MSTGSFPGVKCGRGVLLTTHPLLVPRSWKSTAIPLPTLWATRGLLRDHFTFNFFFTIIHYLPTSNVSSWNSRTFLLLDTEHPTLHYYNTYLLTYSMVQSPSWEANWFAASQEIHAFHGTPRFITALTSVRHLPLSWANPIQSTYPHPTSWRSVLILSTHLRLGLPSYITTIANTNNKTKKGQDERGRSWWWWWGGGGEEYVCTVIMFMLSHAPSHSVQTT